MASTKYIGYVGGVAVAAGVGAAMAVAGQGTAHADSTGSAANDSTSSTSQHVNAGPKRGETKTDRAKPLSKLKDSLDKQTDKIEKTAAQVTKSASTVSKSITDTLTKPAKPLVKPVIGQLPSKPSAAQFEAEQVTKLKNLFTANKPAPKPVEDKPDTVVDDQTDIKSAVQPASKTVTVPRLTAAAQKQADTRATTPWSPNPFRADDPEPTDIPPSIIQLRDTLRAALPPQLDPLVREATEQIYRASQMVPWVNVVVPITKIVPNLAPALGDDFTAARDARQIIINELIKTTPPGAFLYYGYDLVADLINLEEPADALKQQFFITAWNILDPLQLAHNPGKSGIGQAAGS